MDIALLNDMRFAVMSGMLFTSILIMTAEESATVFPMLQKIWRCYRIYQDMNRKRSSDKVSHDFCEIDMTDFES